MDVVYIVGPGSRWEDNELRYSLRSIDRHLDGCGRVFVIGQCPQDIQKRVTFIEMDNQGRSREERIKNKILRACKIADLSDDFILFNDDHFLLRQVGVHIPYFYDGSLEETAAYRRNRDAYQRSLVNTRGVLASLDLPTNHFDVHTPLIYSKGEFVRVMNSYDWSVPFGYVVKSLYCNTLKVPAIYRQDCKIDIELGAREIMQLIKNRSIFSIGDRALEGAKRLLPELYPEPSRWEMCEKVVNLL